SSKCSRCGCLRLSIPICATQLPTSYQKRGDYNLTLQLRRAAVSVALNIAEGSTGQSDAEQTRFLLIETVACQHLIFRRQYLADPALLRQAYQASDKLAAKLQSMRRFLSANRKLGETPEEYDFDSGTPFDESTNST